jgi:antitoxin MazE
MITYKDGSNMQLSIVAIGNSKGIRIPKAILEQCNIRDQIELEVENGRIILEPVHVSPRRGWDEEFREMAANDDDSLLIPDSIEIEMDDWDW